MALLYVDEHNASLNRSPVASGTTIMEGEFIVQNTDGEVVPADPASDALPHGIVVHHAGSTSDALVKHDEDYVSYDSLWQFDGDEGDYLYWQPLASVDQIRPRTIDEQTSPSSSEPSFGEGDEVGIVNLGSGETRIVPSGYTYDGTTYSEGGAGDYINIGRVDKVPQEFRIGTTYDQRLPVRLDADIFTTSG